MRKSGLSILPNNGDTRGVGELVINIETVNLFSITAYLWAEDEKSWFAYLMQVF